MAGSIGDITRRTPQIFTDKFLKSLKSADKSYRITDAGCEGLMLDVTAAGGRNWIYRYTFNNKPINMSLKASYPALSLADARDRVRLLQGLKARGINPIEQRRETEQQAKDKTVQPEVVTLEQAYRDYCRFKTTAFGDNPPAWSYETEKKHNIRVYNFVIPLIGKRAVHELTETDLENVLLSIQKHGTLANRDKVKTLFNGLFDWAKYHIKDPETGQALMTRNIALFISSTPFIKHKPEKFKHVTTDKQLKELVIKIESMAGTYEVKQAIKLAILLFTRPANIVGLEWAQIDLQHETVTYSKDVMKTKTGFITPLPRQALEILNNMHPITGHSAFVFLSPYGGAGKPISRDSLSNALRRNGITEVSPHGFRHTASTALNEMGYNVDEIEAQLAHQIGGVRGVYNGATYLDRRRVLLQSWANYLDSLIVL